MELKDEPIQLNENRTNNNHRHHNNQYSAINCQNINNLNNNNDNEHDNNNSTASSSSSPSNKLPDNSNNSEQETSISIGGSGVGGWHPSTFTTLSMSTKHSDDKQPRSASDTAIESSVVNIINAGGGDSRIVQPESFKDGPNIANLTCGFGYFQLFLAALVFIRYYSLSLMTSSGPLLAPEVPFECTIPDNLINMIDKPKNETMDQFLASKCTIPLLNGTTYHCQEFWFNKTETGFTMTDSLELVCDRAYLKSSFQSALSLGVLLAALLWGPISDQHGRLFVVRLCFLWSFAWGCVSYFAQSFQLYTIARTFVTFGDTGLVGSLSLIMVELIPIRLRGMILMIVYTGWSLGVMFMPFVCDYFLNYKLSTLFTIIVHLITCVPLLLVGESIRWSMVMGDFDYAKSELRRVHKWNGHCPSDFETQFAQTKEMYRLMKPDNSDLRNAQNRKPIRNLLINLWNSYKLVGEFFRSWRLAFTTFVLIWIAFNGELFYMLFVLINSDIGEAKLTNYFVGFLMECLSTVVGIIMTSYLTRRLSVLSTMIIVSVSCFTLALTYESHLTISVIAMNFGKIFISNLTSLSWVLGNESFPTTLRQTGIGITGGLGSFGAVVAPFVRTELTEMIGFGNVMFLLAVIVFLSSWISLMIRETKDSDLPDNLDQMADNGSPNIDCISSIPSNNNNNCDINSTNREASSSLMTSDTNVVENDNQNDKIIDVTPDNRFQ